MRGCTWVAILLGGMLIACGRSQLLGLATPAPVSDGRPPAAPGPGFAPSSPASPAAPPPTARAGADAPEPPPIIGEPALPPPDEHEVRTILLGEVKNARDLGGVPLGRGLAVAYGELFRGPPLAGLSPAGCGEVGRLDIRTVIDLRVDSEREIKPEAECVQQTTRSVLAPLPVPYDLSPEAYIEDLNTFDSIAEVFQVLGDPSAYPVYFHCTWGRDRTGVVAAVILLALGASRTDIMEEYLISLETVGAYRFSLEAVFDEVERNGGIEAFLARAGVSPEQLMTLRARLTRTP